MPNHPSLSAIGTGSSAKRASDGATKTVHLSNIQGEHV